MKELIIGTGNKAKKKAFRSVFAPLGITILGTDELGISLDIQEDGSTAQENARKKSLAYAQAVDRPVLSLDNALYLQGLSEDEQPGIHTRRVPEKRGRATDEELLAFYAKTVQQLGGRIEGYWEYAICLADAQGRTLEKTFRTQRIFVAETSPVLLPGYPLESIQIDPVSGMYISEMTEEEQASFWQKTIGEPLVAFIREAEQSFLASESLARHEQG